MLFEESAKIFGHRTKGALNYFKDCKDFHKTYAFVAAFAEAASKVSIRPFSKSCIISVLFILKRNGYLLFEKVFLYQNFLLFILRSVSSCYSCFEVRL